VEHGAASVDGVSFGAWSRVCVGECEEYVCGKKESRVEQEDVSCCWTVALHVAFIISVMHP
jgi:hypothetical protein